MFNLVVPNIHEHYTTIGIEELMILNVGGDEHIGRSPR